MPPTRSIFYKTEDGPELLYWGEVSADLQLAIKIAVRLMVLSRWWGVFLEAPSPHRWPTTDRKPYDYVTTFDDWKAGLIDISPAAINEALAAAYIRHLRRDAAEKYALEKVKARA